MKLDLKAVQEGATVALSVAELATRIIGHVRQVDCFEKLGPVLDDLAEGVPQMIEAVKTGTVAEHEDNPESGADQADQVEEPAQPTDSQKSEPQS